MSYFSRTEVGGLSVSRMIIGTNWFVGYSHTSPAKDSYIKEHTHKPEKIADIIEVFLNEGIDTLMGILENDHNLLQGIEEAEQRTGKKVIKITTPIINVDDNDQARGQAEAVFDRSLKIGADICMPHHSSVEQLVNKNLRKIVRLEDYIKMIKDRGMIPGLSAHMPEIITYSDTNNYDVETYIQIYNSAGFLMQIEVELVNRIIQNAKKPVMTIKSMAAGRLTPFVGLPFSWNTLREQDMITVGTNTPKEAAEVIEISRACLENRKVNVEGRGTPAKNTIIND